MTEIQPALSEAKPGQIEKAGLELSRADGVVTVALNRPNQHNALTPALIAGLTRVFERLSEDDSVRVVVLTGRGRSFCAGADLSWMRESADLSNEDNLAGAQAIFDLMWAVDTFPRPVLGRVNGAAIGGGAGLVCCCDIVVAVERATFAFSETRLGLVPAVISPFALAKIGVGAARELFLTGERFNAPRAQEIGMVQHVTEDGQALDEIVAGRVAALLLGAPGAQAKAKELIRLVAHRPRKEMRSLTSKAIAARRASDEGREGMSAFLEKRRPAWQEWEPETPSDAEGMED